MKLILKPFICIALFLQILSLGEVKAEELVRHKQNINYGAESIIRHYMSNIDIVCDRHLGKPSFTMYIEGVTTANSIDVDMFDVVDFEIVKSRVYFCGVHYYGNDLRGRIGYFDLIGFPSASNVQVYYFDILWMTDIQAIEVADLAMKMHMLVIGKGLEDTPLLVDFKDEGTTYWDVKSTEIYNDSLSLSDLAVTQNYVVVTSTKEKSQNREGYLLYFHKPTNPGASIFQSGDISYQYFGTNISPRIIIRTHKNDVFVVAHTPYYPNNSPDFYVTTCTGKDINDRYILSLPNTIKHPCLRDIATEKDKLFAHLLINEEDNGIPYSIVYEMPLALSGNTLPTYGHSYNGVYATSLSRRSDFSHFVMSGFNCTNGSPYIIKYMAGVFSCGCLPRVDNMTMKVDFSKEPIAISFPYAVGQIEPVPNEHGTYVHNVTVDCTAQAKDPK